MKLYTTRKVFDRFTGKPNGEDFAPTGKYICDYTGVVIDGDENPECEPMYKLKVSYNNDSEEVYYYDEVKEEFEEMGIDYGTMLSEPYTFAVNEDYTDVSIGLVQEWMAERAEKKSVFYKCATIEQAMRIARVRTVLRLLKEKIFTAAELGLVEE